MELKNLILLLLMVIIVKNIVTLNVNCLRSRAKQCLLRDLVYTHEIDILFLQEVNMENLDFLGPKFNYIVNVGTEERGTAIAYRAGINIINVEKHVSGRVTAALTEDKTLYLNVYLPSGSNKRMEREEMINKIMPYYLRVSYEMIILGGDFNCVMNPKDQTGAYHPSHAMGRLYNDLQLCDVWEYVHKNHVEFTFCRGHSASRLDRFYINKQQTSTIYNITTLPVAFSDHCCLKLQLEIQERIPILYGRGYWKLNTRLLSVMGAKEEFQQRWSVMENRASRSHESDIIKWMKIYKPGIQAFFKRKGVEEANKRKCQMQYYYTLLNDLHNKQQGNNSVQSHIKAVQRRILRIQEQYLEGNIVRARKKSVIEEEKGSLYFIAAEKRATSFKFIESLTEVKPKQSNAECLNTAFLHFSELYREQACSTSAMEEIMPQIQNKLTVEEQEDLDKPITLDELELTINGASMSSAPGPDGITYNFYKEYWKIVKYTLLQTLNSVMVHNKYIPGFNDGIIILIPKTKHPRITSDYRPITLLNTDYKLLMKVLASRLRNKLGSILNIGQTCGIANKKITHVLMAIRDTIDHYTDYPNEEAALLSLDFEKAFDNISHPYMYKVLQQMGFTDKFVGTLQTLYKDAHSRIQINGFLSKPVPIQRSVRQGCPLSMSLFALCVEPFIRLVHTYLNNIPNPKQMFIVRAYADDINILLRDTAQVHMIPKIVNLYCQASTAKINYEKSTLMPLGSWPQNITINRIPTKLETKILGMLVCPKVENMIEKNWTTLVNSLRGSLVSQLSRRLNLLQKVWHINIFMLSKFWYLAQVLPFTDKYAARINLAIGYYLWRGFIYKVARDQLRLPITTGGLGLVDIKQKCTALFLRQILYAKKEIGDEQDIVYWSRINSPARHSWLFETWKTLEAFNISTIEQVPKTRDLYNQLISRQQCTPNVMIKYPNYPWKDIWKQFKTPNIPSDWKMAAYQVINEIIPTEEKKYRHNISRSPMCLICGKLDTQLHRISSCQNVEVWKWTCNLLHKLLPDAHIGSIKEIITKLQAYSSRHKFLQTWVAMGYLYYVTEAEQHTIDGFRKLLIRASLELEKKTSRTVLPQLNRLFV